MVTFRRTADLANSVMTQRMGCQLGSKIVDAKSWQPSPCGRIHRYMQAVLSWKACGARLGAALRALQAEASCCHKLEALPYVPLKVVKEASCCFLNGSCAWSDLAGPVLRHCNLCWLGEVLCASGICVCCLRTARCQMIQMQMQR